MQRLIRMRERGAAGLEYSGFIVIAALVVGSILLAVGGPSNVVSRGVTAALCKIFTLGQGSCDVPASPADAHKPPEPCVVAANGHELNAKAGALIAGSRGEQWYVETLADGTYRVTRGVSEGVSVNGGAGFSVTGTWNDRTVGVEAGGSASIGADFIEGDVYNVSTQEEVSRLLHAHISEVSKDTFLGDESIDIPFTGIKLPNPVRWGANEVTDLAGVPHLPESDETFYAGGVSAEASISATYLRENAQANVGAQGVIGVRTARDGSTTTYYSAKFNLGGSSSEWAKDDDGDGRFETLGADGTVDGAIEVERDADGNVTAISAKIGAEGTAVNGPTDGGVGGRWEQTVELPVDTPANQAVASNFLNAMNMGPMPGMPNYVPSFSPSDMVLDPIAVATATNAFYSAAKSDGYLTRQTYTLEDSTKALNFDAAWIAEVSAGAGYTASELKSTSAKYFDGQNWVNWSGCAA